MRWLLWMYMRSMWTWRIFTNIEHTIWEWNGYTIIYGWRRTKCSDLTSLSQLSPTCEQHQNEAIPRWSLRYMDVRRVEIRTVLRPIQPNLNSTFTFQLHQSDDDKVETFSLISRTCVANFEAHYSVELIYFSFFPALRRRRKKFS